jgi:signal recognition particle subunit SRP54
MGPIKDIFSRMPGMGGIADQVEESELGRVQALVSSMTRGERQQPEIIDKSRAARIAGGCGRKPKDVTELVKRFDQMKGLMAMMGQQSGLLGKMPGMGKMGGMPNLAGAGGMPGMPGMPGMDPMSMLGEGGRSGPIRSKDADARRKKKRKQSKNSRRKGRNR